MVFVSHGFCDPLKNIGKNRKNLVVSHGFSQELNSCQMSRTSPGVPPRVRRHPKHRSLRPSRVLHLKDLRNLRKVDFGQVFSWIYGYSFNVRTDLSDFLVSLNDLKSKNMIHDRPSSIYGRFAALRT